ncbi:MAG: ZIP family metal transporter [Candidatus Saccharibacteria bacterium]|nr:ZIP family metal transporter [Candidatus Saccharibacteria bacterium]
MATYWHIIFFSLIGGIFSLIGGILLLKSKKSADKLAFYATPFAAGALLAAVFLDLLKEGIHEGEGDTVMLAALSGVLLFFLAERFLRWFHHHHSHEEEETANKSLIIVGDTMHNALDGVAITAGFLISVPTGIVTTIAVAAHEIPQEIGDFGLLLKKGMRRRNVLIVNVLSALATTAAAVLTFALGSEEVLPIGILLGLSAGFLLYIATSDIIPSIHAHAAKKKLLDVQPLLLLFGVLVVGLIINIAHDYIDAGHDHGHEEESSTTHMEQSHGEAIEIADESLVPTLELELLDDNKQGYNLHIETTNFTFSGEHVGEEPEIGEGHAHIYVNGEKISRIYTDVVHLPDVHEGDKVRVTLNAHDHSEFAHDGEIISATTTAGDDHSHDAEDDHGH